MIASLEGNTMRWSSGRFPDSCLNGSLAFPERPFQWRYELILDKYSGGAAPAFYRLPYYLPFGSTRRIAGIILAFFRELSAFHGKINTHDKNH
jgi:hypothetical protein